MSHELNEVKARKAFVDDQAISVSMCVTQMNRFQEQCGFELYRFFSTLLKQTIFLSLPNNTAEDRAKKDILIASCSRAQSAERKQMYLEYVARWKLDGNE